MNSHGYEALRNLVIFYSEIFVVRLYLIFALKNISKCNSLFRRKHESVQEIISTYKS